MKKLLPILFLWFLINHLNATFNKLVAIDVPQYLDTKQPHQLQNWVKSLGTTDAEILYYNESYVLARVDDASGYHFLCEADRPGLYLLSAKNPQTLAKLPNDTAVLWDMGTSLLVHSSLSEISLRQQYKGKVLPLRREPIVLKDTNIKIPEELSERNFISDMISEASQDSLISYVQHLQDYGSRYAGLPNRWEIANWLKTKFQSFGYGDASITEIPWTNGFQYNVSAKLTGTMYPDTYILVGAHYDSQNWDQDPMLYAPGADDNGTGVAAILEIARIMKAIGYQPRCSILFIPLAAEEIGCIGTYGFINNALQSEMDIRLMINMDMIGSTAPYPNDLRMLLHSYDGCLEHAHYAASLVTLYTDLEPVMGPLNQFITDSYPFWDAGFPAISFDEFWLCPNYHSDLDLVEFLDPVYFTKMTKSVMAMAAHYSYLPIPPQNVRVMDSGTGTSLRVTWDMANDSVVDHYVVRWGLTEFSDIFEAETTSNGLTINNLTEGQQVFVAVSSADDSGLESHQSTANGIPLSLPRVPQGFTDFPITGGIRMTWEASPELDVTAYHLYRSLAENDPGSLIATTIDTEFQDLGLAGLSQYYCYWLTAVDSDGNESDRTAVLKSRPITLDNGILIIDETKNYAGTNPLQPTDEMVDSFFDRITDNLPVNAHLDLENHPEALRLADFSVFSSILWHGNDFADVTAPFAAKTAIKEYIQMGGKVLFNLCHPSMAFELNAGFPASFSDTTYINEILGVQAVDYSASARFRYALSELDVFCDLQVDSLKTMANFNNHIFHVEAITPNPQSQAFYTYGSDYASDSAQGTLNGETVAIRNSYQLGQTVLLSFPLYFMEEASAKELMQSIFVNWFNEAVSNQDNVTPSAQGIQLSKAYPNPFKDKATLCLSGVRDKGNVILEIFNLKGQQVYRYQCAVTNSTLSLNWDGKDEHGVRLSSGVYLAKVSQGGSSKTLKLLLLK